MKVHVSDLIPGDQIEQDAFNSHGVHILRKGTALRTQDIAKLLQHNIDFIEIAPREEESVFAIEAPSEPQDLVDKVTSQYELAFEGCEALFSEALQTGSFDEVVAEESFRPLAHTISKHKDAVSLLLMFNSDDDYTYRHSIQVGMLSYYIASWLGYSEEEAYDIGKAGYLHDIGKCKIPTEILEKPGKLTKEEFETVKLHTVYGYELIRESIDNEAIALAALQHHERMDGSGYPQRLHRDEIHPYSQICAVADVYSAMTTTRVYQSRQSMLTALRELHRLSFGKLSAKPTHAFIEQMLPNFIGKKVLLTTGEQGTIVMNNPSNYFRPLVQVGSRFIDLSRESEDETAIRDILQI
ncbi:HD-GYP domain-containing protein [Paenibacillus cisolokensis]|uniref:HD-GYP domain-containing protein n=1 Tax=Paenibacillus cisolokensis TaxID=1658519 RepID=UPI003D2E6279